MIEKHKQSIEAIMGSNKDFKKKKEIQFCMIKCGNFIECISCPEKLTRLIRESTAKPS